MLFSQVLIALSLVGMAYCDPKTQLAQLALFALLVAFPLPPRTSSSMPIASNPLPSGCRRPWPRPI